MNKSRICGEFIMKSSVNDNVWIVIPAFNEKTALPNVLPSLSSYNVVVVDDGSNDGTADASLSGRAHWLRHIINLGQGAALQTGIDYALEQGAEIIVSFDADGQMDPADIPALIAPLVKKEADVALGTRFGAGSSVTIPAARRLILHLGRIFTNLSSGLQLSDTHNGFRAFTRDAAKKIKIKQNRMAHASEIIETIAKEKLRVREVPVSIRYTDYSKAKGQRSWGFLNILWDLFFNPKGRS